MKDKTDAWIVVRFDGLAVEREDCVAIKGVYDSQQEAEAAAERGRQQLPPNARYRVVHSRRFIPPSEATRDREHKEAHRDAAWVQWWSNLNPLPTPVAPEFLWRFAERLPKDVWHRALQPVLSSYAETLVANALNAERLPENSDAGDIRLPDGSVVEVKALWLDPERAKAPSVQFRSDRVQQLALVLFAPDLKSLTARLIPANVLSHFERPGPHRRDAQVSNLRITQDLINAPGSSELILG